MYGRCNLLHDSTQFTNMIPEKLDGEQLMAVDYCKLKEVITIAAAVLKIVYLSEWINTGSST